MRVYHDSQEPWGHCRGCHASGGLVSWAARVWGVPLPEARDRLQLPAGTPGRDADRRQRQQQGLTQLWAASDEPGALRGQVALLSLNPPVDPTALRQAMQWLRGTTIRDLKQSWPTRSLDLPGRGDLGLIPLEDLPGRLISLLLRTETGDLRSEDLPRTLVTGLGELPEHDSLIVHTDPLAVVGYQLRNWQERRQVLPLVGLVPGRTPNPYWIQLGVPLVFWGPLTPTLVREMASCRGLHTTAKLSGNRLLAAAFKTLLTTGVPWRLATARHLQALPSGDALAFLQAARLSQQDLQEVLDLCSESARTRLLPVLATEPQVVTYGPHQVQLRPDGWYVNQRLISNVTLKILKIDEARDPLCHIEIGYQNKTLRTKVPASRLEAKPERYLRWKFLRRQWSPPFVEPKWRDHLFQLAYLFGNPEVSPRLPPLGWHAASRGLVLESCCLHDDGKVTYYPDERKLTLGRLPTPIGLSSRVIHDLEYRAEFPVLVALVVYTAASLLQKLTGCVPPPLLLTGDGAAGALWTTELDCPRLYLTKTTDLDKFRRQADVARRHSYPLLVSLRERQHRLELHALAGRQSLLLEAKRPTRTLELGAILPTWSLEIPAHLASVVDMENAPAADDLLVAYLRDLSKRAYHYEHQPTGVLPSLQADFATWWAEQGGSAYPDVLQTPRETAESTLTALLELFPLCLLRQGFPLESAGPLTIWYDADSIWIRPRELLDQLDSKGIRLEESRWAERLTAAGLLTIEDKYWRLPTSVLPQGRRAATPGVAQEWMGRIDLNARICVRDTETQGKEPSSWPSRISCTGPSRPPPTDPSSTVRCGWPTSTATSWWNWNCSAAKTTTRPSAG